MHEPASTKPSVLLVDDSRVIRRAIAQILRQEFEITEKEDGESAWTALQESVFDVVISDVEMPHLDGCGLLQRLRQGERQALKDLPVIVITGADDEATKQRAFDCGATDFIVKPIDRMQLLARVRAHVTLERTNRRLLATVEERALEDLDTGVANKRGLLKRGAADLAYARRHGSNLAIVRFNLALAEPNGIAAAAGWLRTRIRQEETLAHLGNGGFAVLSPCADTEEAHALAARLRRELDLGTEAHGLRLVRYGVVSLEDIEGDIDEMLALAEAAAETVDAPAPARELPEALEPPAPAPVPETVETPDPRPQASPDPAPAVDFADWVLDDIDASVPLFAETPAEAADVPEVEAAAADAASLPAAALEEPRPGAAPPPTLEEALEWLRAGQIEALRPHLRRLTLKALPLLELCNNHENLGLGFVIHSLRSKLT